MIQLTDENYNQVIETTNKNIFIDFFMPTCSPCKELLKILPILEQKYPKILILKCNINENPKIANKYMVRSVPLTLMINNKKEIKDANLGLKDFNYYDILFKKYSK